jgi:hypothetical protein
MGSMVHKVCPAQLVSQVQLAQLAPQVRKVSQVSLVTPVPLAQRVLV